MFLYPKSYDVIVVGAGHAGIEAALACARLGCSTLLTTMDLDAIGKMSCNPAIGGLGKGHLVREIDALGGVMGQITDQTGIQFRMLNRSKGSAVWAPRAQCDKRAYSAAMKALCERATHLDVKQAQAGALWSEGGILRGIESTLGTRYAGQVVILTTGTFLRGLMHVGMARQSGGRAGEQAAEGLSASLRDHGLELVRLKTGTPPRLHAASIQWEGLEVQPGDAPPLPFSFLHEQSYQDPETFHVEHRWQPPMRQLPCHLTHTTSRTAEIIRSNLHLSPMYAGIIEGIGPRYCPSIEDKIVRFADKPTHHVFLEPEGLSTEEIYVNGLSTSLPLSVQVDFIRSIAGLENAEIMRPGYAVEYDCSPPTQLYPWLESKRVQNLFLAGQINGTSGYEEAAGQGIVAGLNAARRIRGEHPLLFSRTESYLGVMVDDLVTKGAPEPYRMFTSRAEYRLALRQDNADLRLTPLGREVGSVDESRWAGFQRKRTAIEALKQALATTRRDGLSLERLLKRTEVTLDQFTRDLGVDAIPEDVRNCVEMDVKYAGYLKKQGESIERIQRLEQKRIPANFDYASLRALRNESRQKLSEIRPQTLGQASRIAGITPADLEILFIHLKKSESLN